MASREETQSGEFIDGVVDVLDRTRGYRLTRLKMQYLTLLEGWIGSRVVSVLDSGADGPGLKSEPRCCRVTVLGKLFTPILPLKGCEGNMRALREEMAAYTAGFMTHVTYRLTAKNRDQLRNPTLGNRVLNTCTCTVYVQVWYTCDTRLVCGDGGRL